MPFECRKCEIYFENQLAYELHLLGHKIQNLQQIFENLIDVIADIQEEDKEKFKWSGNITPSPYLYFIS